MRAECVPGADAHPSSVIVKSARPQLDEFVEITGAELVGRQEPNAGGVLKGEFAGLRRLRVGQYRVIYEAVREELVVLVVRVGLRKDVYRKR